MTTHYAFCTFGMFIIDEIEYLGERKPQQNLIGGAGVYAALGARLCAGHLRANTVSWIVDIGQDFPPKFKDLINSWRTSCVFRYDANRLTTRAWNGYGQNEHRDFKYLTPKVRLEVHSLTDEQCLSSSFHMVCSSTRCIDLVTKLKTRRAALRPNASGPVIIWEPIPDLCTPDELENLEKAADLVSVVSPNADELAQFFPRDSRLTQDEMVNSFIGWSRGRTQATHCVIREGATGSSIYIAPDHCRSSLKLSKAFLIPRIHLPAYHSKSESSRVIDPTGGGNAYLGGLAIGMTTALEGSVVTMKIQSKLPSLQMHNAGADVVFNLLRGAVYSVIAASYAIEQAGVPELLQTNQLDEEQWNGETFLGRVERYLIRESAYINQQITDLLK